MKYMKNKRDIPFFILTILALISALACIGVWIRIAFAEAGIETVAHPKAGIAQSINQHKIRKTAPPWMGSPLQFEYPNREQTLRLPTVLRALKINRGSHVADIGAGGGWLSVRLARQVGPDGVVYAQEILPKFTQFIEQRARREKLSNIRTVLGTPTDPKLTPHSLDAVIILNAYHEFSEPLDMLDKIRSAMKPGARLGIIERDNEELRREARDAYARTGQIKRRVDEQTDNNPLTDDHRLALPIIEREAEIAAFARIGSMELGDDNYLLVLERK